MAHHFLFETGSSGFFAEVLEAAPVVASQLQALAEEHVSLQAQLHRVVEDAQWADQAPDAWDRVVERFDAFTAQLRRHEHDEDCVVADALTQDEGGSG